MAFTFHYVSILIRCFPVLHVISSIYIPLCLYFNNALHHSPRMRYSIYIPLCLYFNSKFKFFLVCPRLFTFHYVSILIRTITFTKGDGTTFTFHYVSILIICFVFFHCFSFLFTFHYVSILIP